jgi:hypothetical protein
MNFPPSAKEIFRRLQKNDDSGFPDLSELSIISVEGSLDVSLADGDVVAAAKPRGATGNTRLRRARGDARFRFKCNISDFVTWEATEAAACDLARFVGKSSEGACGWDSVIAAASVGDSAQTTSIGEVKRGEALPLHSGPLNSLFQEQEEDFAVCCRSCTSDALQELAFKQRDVTQVTITIKLQQQQVAKVVRVVLSWRHVGECEAAAPVECTPPATRFSQQERWNQLEQKVAAIFSTYAAVREFSHDGEYYLLWRNVLERRGAAE